MKKTISTLVAILFIALNCISQKVSNNGDYEIHICKDKMTDKEYAFGNKYLMCSDDEKIGFTVYVSWKKEGKDVSYRGLSVTSAGIGGCVENCKLIILFEDETKVTLESWNDFNCKGTSYFDLRSKEFDNFNSKKVTAIRFTNGRSYESYTYKLKPEEQSFFIEAKEALSKPYKTVSCDN